MCKSFLLAKVNCKDKKNKCGKDFHQINYCKLEVQNKYIIIIHTQIIRNESGSFFITISSEPFFVKSLNQFVAAFLFFFFKSLKISHAHTHKHTFTLKIKQMISKYTKIRICFVLAKLTSQ